MNCCIVNMIYWDEQPERERKREFVHDIHVWCNNKCSCHAQSTSVCNEYSFYPVSFGKFMNHDEAH